MKSPFPLEENSGRYISLASWTAVSYHMAIYPRKYSRAQNALFSVCSFNPVISGYMYTTVVTISC